MIRKEVDHGHDPSAGGGAAEHQIGGGVRPAQADDQQAPEVGADGARQAGREGPSTPLRAGPTPPFLTAGGVHFIISLAHIDQGKPR
jgi:hypothetical protein